MSTRVPRGPLKLFISRLRNETSFPPLASNDVLLDIAIECCSDTQPCQETFLKSILLRNVRLLSSARRCRCTRRPAVLDRHDDDPFLVFEVLIDDQHPAPGPEQESKSMPTAPQRRSNVREVFEGSQ